jgi:hypothetical protein
LIAVYCSHCGAENQTGDRYCVNCGSALRGSGAPGSTPVSMRQRFSRLFGTTPRARLLSAGTAVAVAVAVAAFIALKPSEGEATEDAFTRAGDRVCLEGKQRVAALERQTLQQQPPDVSTFAAALVTVVAEWRSDFQQLSTPQVHAAGARALDSALLDVLIRAGALARVSRGGSASQIADQAKLVDDASKEVDRRVEQLGLERCAVVEIGRGSFAAETP